MRTDRVARPTMTTGQGARHVGSSRAPATEKSLSAGALRASSLPATPVVTMRLAQTIVAVKRGNLGAANPAEIARAAHGA